MLRSTLRRSLLHSSIGDSSLIIIIIIIIIIIDDRAGGRRLEIKGKEQYDLLWKKHNP